MAEIARDVISLAKDKAVPGVGVGVGVGLWLLDKFDEHANDLEQATLAKAQKLLGNCNHLKICPHHSYAVVPWKGGYSVNADIVMTVTDEKEGCAFVFEGVALYHFHTNLNVADLSARPVRWDPNTGQVGHYTPVVTKCPRCFPQDQKTQEEKPGASTPQPKLFTVPVGRVR